MREDIVGGDYSAICPNCGETVWSGRIESKIITEDGYDPIFTPSYPNENEINLNPIKIICKKCRKNNIHFKVVNKEFVDISKELITKGYLFSTHIFKHEIYILIFYDEFILSNLSKELENSDWKCNKLPSGIIQIKFNPKIENTVCNDYEIDTLYSAIKKLPSKRKETK